MGAGGVGELRITNYELRTGSRGWGITNYKQGAGGAPSSALALALRSSASSLAEYHPKPKTQNPVTERSRSITHS